MEQRAAMGRIPYKNNPAPICTHTDIQHITLKTSLNHQNHDNRVFVKASDFGGKQILLCTELAVTSRVESDTLSDKTPSTKTAMVALYPLYPCSLSGASVLATPAATGEVQ